MEFPPLKTQPPERDQNISRLQAGLRQSTVAAGVTQANKRPMCRSIGSPLQSFRAASNMGLKERPLVMLHLLDSAYGHLVQPALRSDRRLFVLWCLPAIASVGLKQPTVLIVPEVGIENRQQLAPAGSIFDGHQQFHAPIEVAWHPVRATDER